MISAVILSVALSTTMAPPGEAVINHGHPAHFGQPVIRVFERRAEDTNRKLAWVAYCRQLDQLWLDYRSASSTPAAWRIYANASGQAKYRYVFGDPYLAPIVDEFVW